MDVLSVRLYQKNEGSEYSGLVKRNPLRFRLPSVYLRARYRYETRGSRDITFIVHKIPLGSAAPVPGQREKMYNGPGGLAIVVIRTERVKQ